MLKQKYIMVLLIKEQESYTISKEIRINPSKKEYKGYPIDISSYSYRKGLKKFFFFDLNKGIQLYIQNGKLPNINTKIIDDILAKKIISELTSDINGMNFKEKIFNFIIGSAIGGLIGYIIGSMIV